MSGEGLAFVGTNVLPYAHDATGRERQDRAAELVGSLAQSWPAPSSVQVSEGVAVDSYTFLVSRSGAVPLPPPNLFRLHSSRSKASRRFFSSSAERFVATIVKS